MTKIVIKKGGKEVVGYGRPPKAHQFKPGQSGNPKGRPKAIPTLREAVAREAAKLVKVKQGDEVVTVSKVTALARRVFGKALEGDLAAARLVFQLIDDPNTLNAEALENIPLPDDEVIQRMVQRFEPLRLGKGGPK